MKNDKYIYALGFFDGVHLGHQALLRETLLLARRQGCGAGAITFDAHPQSLFTQTPPPMINTVADRERLLREYGMERVLRLPVTREVMSTPWQTFLEQLLDAGAAGFVCGYDFRFGDRGTGDAEKLSAFCRERGPPCTVVPEETLEGVRVSSTHIRRLLEAGDLTGAVRFLGHPHLLSGQVVAGRRLGRTIGVPTANILLPPGVAVPKLGVYACTVHTAGHSYVAVTTWGSRPTVQGHQVRTESWILDFDGDLYGREITLEIPRLLRPEEKFESLEALRAQIQQDAAAAQRLLK